MVVDCHVVAKMRSSNITIPCIELPKIWVCLKMEFMYILIRRWLGQVHCLARVDCLHYECIFLCPHCQSIVVSWPSTSKPFISNTEYSENSENGKRIRIPSTDVTVILQAGVPEELTGNPENDNRTMRFSYIFDKTTAMKRMRWEYLQRRTTLDSADRWYRL